MRILRDSSPIPDDVRNAVMALGNFDGLHLGHLAVIDRTITLAKAQGKPAGMLTFEPHPRRLFKPDLPPLRIVAFREKAAFLKQYGLDFMRVIHFTRAFSEVTAHGFVRDILSKQLRAAHVVTGDDFVFGHKREGNTELLKTLGDEAGIEVTICAPLLIDEHRYSSTRIRSLLKEGRVQDAAQQLGRTYSITGRVTHGDARGRELGFPTANVTPGKIFTPMHGVYAVRTHLRGKWLSGVANIGTRPTFGGTQVKCEVHLFDWHEMIYGERLEIDVIACIRGEQRFESVQALTAQIAQDVTAAKTLLAGF